MPALTPRVFKLKDGTVVQWGFPDGHVELQVKVAFVPVTFKLDREDIAVARGILAEAERLHSEKGNL